MLTVWLHPVAFKAESYAGILVHNITLTPTESGWGWGRTNLDTHYGISTARCWGLEANSECPLHTPSPIKKQPSQTRRCTPAAHVHERLWADLTLVQPRVGTPQPRGLSLVERGQPCDHSTGKCSHLFPSGILMFYKHYHIKKVARFREDAHPALCCTVLHVSTYWRVLKLEVRKTPPCSKHASSSHYIGVTGTEGKSQETKPRETVWPPILFRQGDSQNQCPSPTGRQGAHSGQDMNSTGLAP